MPYSTKWAAAYYHRSEATIRNWAEEFANNLSPTGAPESGKTRQFTVEDMKTLDLVSTMKAQRKTYEEIHAALDAGMRGDAPELDEKDLEVLSAAEGERRVTLEVGALQRAIVELRTKLSRAEEVASQVEAVHTENTQLTTRLEMTSEQLAQAQTQVETLRQQISGMSKEFQEKVEKLATEKGQSAGDSYTRGVMDTLQRLGHLPTEQSQQNNSDG